MKRRFVAPFLAVLALLAFAPAAHAGHWVTKEIKWRTSGIGPTGSSTTIFVRDTTFAPNPIKSSMTADTTGTFDLNNASIWLPDPGAATTTDTLWVAYLMIQPDTTVAVIPTVGSVTYEIDGRVGGYGSPANLNGWTQIDSTVATFVNNGLGGQSLVYNNVLACPIRVIGGLGGVGSVEPQGALNFAYRLMAFDALRVRLTAAAGVMSGNVRAFIRYYKEEGVD